MSARALVLISLLTVSCARPNYQDAAAKTPSGSCAVEFPSRQLCASFQWDKMPGKKQMGSFNLLFHAASDKAEKPQPLDPAAEIKVLLWMPSMGHGSSAVRITRLSEGEYLVDKVFFAMPGEWEIRFQLKSPEGVIEEDFINIVF